MLTTFKTSNFQIPGKAVLIIFCDYLSSYEHHAGIFNYTISIYWSICSCLSDTVIWIVIGHTDFQVIVWRYLSSRMWCHVELSLSLIMQDSLVVIYQHFQSPYWPRLQGSNRPNFTFKMKPIGCPETLVTNYQSTLHSIPEECWSHLYSAEAWNHAWVSHSRRSYS